TVHVAEVFRVDLPALRSRSAMRSIKARDFESTPGQLYWRRSDPERRSTRKGRSADGSLPLSSVGFMAGNPVPGAVGVRYFRIIFTSESFRQASAQCSHSLVQRMQASIPDRCSW